MWVSRTQMQWLHEQVRDFDCRLTALEKAKGSFRVYRWPEYGNDSPYVCMDYADAIRIIAAHVGCEFKYQEGTPTTAVLVKKAK